MEIKEDTYAILKVIQADGTELPLLDSGSNTGTTGQYANFILQSVQEARMEKHQIVETFGESYIFFFGEAPRFLDVAAVLINSNDFNWQGEWWANYNAFLRGTKSVELGARTYLFYEDNIVEGYVLNAQAMNSADSPLTVNLTFRLFVTNYQNISFVGNPDFPIRSTVEVPSDMVVSHVAKDLTTAMSGQQLNAFIGNVSGADPNGRAKGGFDLIRQLPLRSKIVDNVDEWTGPPPEDGPDPFNALRRQIERDIQESRAALEDLIDFVSRYGVNVNNPAFMLAMGLGPNFTEATGFGVGAGAGLFAGATFGATASVGISISASVSFGTQDTNSAFGDLEQQVLDEVIQQQLLESRAQIALDQNGGSVVFRASSPPDFGFAVSASVSVSASIGFGINNDPTHFVLSAGASFAGGTGSSASVIIGGTPSAFAMASFSGTFDPTGNASAVPSVSGGR